MTKKLNSFVLSDNTISTMKTFLNRSKDIRKEIGFNLCKIEGNDTLQEDEHCTGSECKIYLSRTCQIGKKVGLYHTHPGNGLGLSRMSLSDIENGYYYGVNCIGGTEDQKIKCFVRKGEMVPKDFKIMHYNRRKFEPYQKQRKVKTWRGFEIVKSRYRERDYIINKLTENYFNVIDIL